MPRFQVRFMKVVPDGAGHDCYTCQFRTEVDASNERDAVAAAGTHFCQDHRILNWKYHADNVESEKIETTSEEDKQDVLVACA